MTRLARFTTIDRQTFLADPDLHHLAERYLADRLKGWMGFRNVLVHFYLQIDHGRSYDVIQRELGDLQAFAARMARFLAP